MYLMSERGVDARDNTYHLLKYMIDNDLLQDKTIIYIINKESADFNKIRLLQDKAGNENLKIIQKSSLKHYFYFCLADTRISTHVFGYSPDAYLFKKLYKVFPKLVKKKGQKDVFLQHGIINTDFPELKYEFNKHLDLFVCSTNQEYEMLLNDYDWQNKYNANGRLVLQQLGLCRYDRLCDSSLNEKKDERYILVMPTWRRWLLNKTDEEFVESNYFNTYKSLLTNQLLQEYLLKCNYKLKFYFHHEFQRYSPFLKNTIESLIEDKYQETIKVCYENEYDVQNLLINASLLITDHSSVYFDFAYMKKPVLYYHFDQEQFVKIHSRQSYFDFKKQGFGEVCFDESDLANRLIHYLTIECHMGTMYQQRVDETFKYTDTNNCKRNIEMIKQCS